MEFPKFLMELNGVGVEEDVEEDGGGGGGWVLVLVLVLVVVVPELICGGFDGDSSLSGSDVAVVETALLDLLLWVLAESTLRSRRGFRPPTRLTRRSSDRAGWLGGA